MWGSRQTMPEIQRLNCSQEWSPYTIHTPFRATSVTEKFILLPTEHASMAGRHGIAFPVDRRITLDVVKEHNLMMTTKEINSHNASLCEPVHTVN